MNNQIITSLLDLDFYKLTMARFVWEKYPNTNVKYAFKNRTQDIKLAKIIPTHIIREQIEQVQKLKFTEEELGFLSSQGDLFPDEFLDFLRNLELPDVSIKVQYDESADLNGIYTPDSFNIETHGPWSTTIFWETIILSIMNELYYSYEVPVNDVTDTLNEGSKRLREKIEKLKANPGVTFSEFGTRRRFSRNWQDGVVASLANALPDQMLGTSNVALAMKYNLKPIGTMAHELFMVMSGAYRARGNDTDGSIVASHNTVLQEWWDLYGVDMSIALTDTYGTEFFFKDMTKEQAENFRGLRQDSGDPFEFGENAIKFYEDKGIDPMSKVVVFSDGLNVDTIIELTKRFEGRINTGYGWGTNLTNDLGHKSLSMVVKAVEADGFGTVKLSDNLAKAMGDPVDVERFKNVFGYTNELDEVCVY